MPKIMGLQPREGQSQKTGKDYKAVIVHYVDEMREREVKAGGRGYICENAFVNDDVFRAALEGHKIDEALNKECTFYYNRGSTFVSELVIYWEPAK